ncbi:3951_t:CDS:2 [Acaulospora colombiana]|uniref:3951_t:CDS:1 n=1 Tax=Acaulospora colombiana TaxID=27376 RepID=A0ACA9KUF0_9GLOM|nr:3951_t:CDS:2 [Acaulospora colombiana]
MDNFLSSLKEISIKTEDENFVDKFSQLSTNENNDLQHYQYQSLENWVEQKWQNKWNNIDSWQNSTTQSQSNNDEGWGSVNTGINEFHRFGFTSSLSSEHLKMGRINIEQPDRMFGTREG